MNAFKIFLENNRIFKNKKYQTDAGKTVDIKSCCGELEKKTFLYKEIEPAKEIIRKNKFILEENIERTTTIGCILRLRKSGVDGNIAALNFANAMFPGGAYVLGGNAQEESLCRASLLYYSIKKCKAMYRYNRLRVLPFYSDRMIYSQDVPVIRNDEGRLLDAPVLCSFITSAAVNRRFAKLFAGDKKINKLMNARIEKIISLAVSHNPQVIIIGAYGCGVFGNKQAVVKPMFEDAVNKYVSDATRVIYAVK